MGGWLSKSGQQGFGNLLIPLKESWSQYRLPKSDAQTSSCLFSKISLRRALPLL